jgi:transposase
MIKKLFTKKEIDICHLILYVKSVSTKGIMYTDEFKQFFIAQS